MVSGIKVRGFEPDVNRTRNLLIWSQTRYHCATDPDEDYILNVKYITIMSLLEKFMLFN
ncbi:hypothetical protein ARALYDRAFT_896404 [Arabidopsis lyrata subsp. lyrata]|uniref:Uncharacterized protein n=1 Tax=Arabidopsis lyrata subsp. lyrata TaxID=81972 RepID=D7L1A9_ARALL|nr:hypothetical protein ARALYDRAFT_896404 [Arabidopsis lyrata subsp. lyrata]